MSNDRYNDSIKDWGLARKHYAGWIPCVNGHLSFSRFGSDDDCATTNIVDNAPHRRIFIAQRRYTSDYAIPAWVLAHIFRADGVTTDFYFIAKTIGADQPVRIDGKEDIIFPDNLGRLQGDVFVVRKHKDRRKNELRHKAFKQLSRLADRHHMRSQGKKTIFEQDDVFKQFSKIKNKLCEEGLFVERYKVVIFRTGEVRISPVQTSFKNRNFSKNNYGSKIDYIDSMSAQVYYFIKDIAHRHYHHRKRQDNIIPLTPASVNNDEDWRRETMWSLVRAILDERRSRQISSFTKAKGILAYADAFQKHLASHRRKPKTLSGFEPITENSEYDLSFMTNSLDARGNQIREKYESRSNIFISLIGTIIAIVALWISGKGSSIEGEPSSIIHLIVRWFVQYPDLLIVIFMSLMSIYLIWARGLMPIPSIAIWVIKFMDSAWFSFAHILVNRWGARGDFIILLLKTSFLSTLLLCAIHFTLSLQGISVLGAIGEWIGWIAEWIGSLRSGSLGTTDGAQNT